MALSDIALKRSVTRSERFFPFRCSQVVSYGLTVFNAAQRFLAALLL
ncbi:hypothetical protein ACMFAK_23670 (plasmid) [Escherichia coli]